MITVMAFTARFGLTAVAAAKEAGLLLDVNEKTMRTWRRDFYNNNSSFSESKQGRHSRPFVLDDENCRHRAAEWVRRNATVKGKPNLTAAKFSSWVNTDLLPSSELPPECPQTTTERTAAKWLNQLGFHSYSLKKRVMAMSVKMSLIIASSFFANWRFWMPRICHHPLAQTS